MVKMVITIMNYIQKIYFIEMENTYDFLSIIVKNSAFRAYN